MLKASDDRTRDTAWRGVADRSPRSEATFIRTGIEGCLRRS